MKNLIINKAMNNIKNNCTYDEIKFAEIKYGLESLYLFITKTIVILLLAYLLGLFKELILVLLFYSLLRATGFGVHAIKSWHCWVSSIIIFIGVPTLIKLFVIPTSLMIGISIFCTLIIFKYAPADTEKRPIISKKRRKIYKIICTSTSILYVLGIIFIPSTYLASILMYSIVLETFMILPYTYKMFGVKYDNYKTYLKSKNIQ